MCEHLPRTMFSIAFISESCSTFIHHHGQSLNPSIYIPYVLFDDLLDFAIIHICLNSYKDAMVCYAKSQETTHYTHRTDSAVSCGIKESCSY
jgi:hypothetical protein